MVTILYEKGENIEALKVVQKRLFSLVRQVQTCLLLMMNSKLISDMEHELKICEVYKEIDDLFGLGELYDGVFLEIYLRMKRIDDAADCLPQGADDLRRLRDDLLVSENPKRHLARCAPEQQIRRQRAGL